MISESFTIEDGRITRTVSLSNRSVESSVAWPVKQFGDSPPDHLWWQAVLRGAEIKSAQQGDIRTVDLFSGVGGLSLGASMACQAIGRRFVPVAAFDVDIDALDVYKCNFAAHVTRQANVAAVIDYHVYGRGQSAEFAYPPEIIDAELASLIGKTDLFLAGPPCQGHSSLNNRTRRSDPRNQLYVCAAVAAIALESRMVVIENVPEVEHDKTDVVATARTLLEKAGYHVSEAVLTASAFAGAQMRRRHFMVATQSPHVELNDSAATLSKRPMTLREAIGDLEDIEPSTYMDELPVLSVQNKKRIDYLFDNDLFELPNAVRPDCHKDGHTYPSVYGRLYWDRPSPTITTGFVTPGRGRYIHPSKRRVITPREAARIQGFPDSFKFFREDRLPSRKHLSKWIGDAVPTQLGYVAVLTALSSDQG